MLGTAAPSPSQLPFCVLTRSSRIVLSMASSMLALSAWLGVNMLAHQVANDARHLIVAGAEQVVVGVRDCNPNVRELRPDCHSAALVRTCVALLVAPGSLRGAGLALNRVARVVASQVHYVRTVLACSARASSSAPAAPRRL